MYHREATARRESNSDASLSTSIDVEDSPPPAKVPINPYSPLTTDSGNANLPSAYMWLEDSLELLAANQASSLACTGENKRRLVPILFVLGGCPNRFCGMQAMMFAMGAPKSAADVIEFWWVKPSTESAQEIDRETLSLHDSGQHKNSPGSSASFYQPLADLFQQRVRVTAFTFGTKKVIHNGVETDRAVIYNEKGAEVLYVIGLWQEDFTLNPMAWSKYIKGKIIYQKSFETGEYFSRQYEIHDGAPFIADFEEGPVLTVLPTAAIKNLWNMGVP